MSGEINCNYSIINDAVHGVMSFPESDKKLLQMVIDSETFQRLRHVKQLGMAELVFPTAVHNRFSHCLGSSYIAVRMADALDLTKEERRYVMLAALLHDIGHGPFSHAFERILVNKSNKKIKHEMWTGNFLKEFEYIFDGEGLDYKILSDLIEKRDRSNTKNYYLMRDVITSQLDADRLDYLVRDSHFCGVPYGNPDLDWIIQHVTRIEETGNPPRLGFFKKAAPAVEHFLLCRRIMTQNVPYHNKVRFFEQLLVFFLIKLLEDDSLLDNLSNVNLSKFLYSVKKYRDTSNISQDRFIYDNYNYYKTLTDYDIWSVIRDFSLTKNGEVSEIAKKIYGRHRHITHEFDEACHGGVASILNKWTKKLDIPEWKAFILEGSIMSYETIDDPILIKDDRKDLVYRIQKYSDILNAIGDKKEFKFYIAIDESINTKEFLDELRRYVPSV